MDASSVQIKPIYTTGRCAGAVAFAFMLFATGLGGGISLVSADAPIQASQPAISLQQAIADRRVRAYAEPAAYGLQQKPMMHLVVIGGDSTSLVLYVAQGTTFSPSNSAYAPVVLTTGVTFTLNSPGPVNLWTLSLLHDRNSPSVFAPISYTVGAILTESHLTRVLAAWETNPMTSVVAAQLAVWAAYEGLPLSQLAGTLGSQVTQRDIDIAASLLSGQLKSSDPPASPTPLETVPAVTLSPASTPSSTPVIGNGTITNAPKDSVVAWVVLGILIGITGAVLVAAITVSLRRRNTAAVPDSSEMQKQVEDTTVIRPVNDRPTDEQPLKARCRFGDYEVECEIEIGGMAYVYKAFNGTNPVALKIPRKRTQEYRYRFQREAMIIETLDHPGIVKFIQTGEIEGRMYIALQYVDGCSLGALLQKRLRPLMPGTAVGIIRQIATALDYAYQKGVICHRDIKPSNLLLDKQGKVYASDFGIAKSKKDQSITTDNEKVGTEIYMSPEQKNANPTIDHRSDIYSLGIVLYEILGGTQLNANSTTLNVTWQFNPPIPATVETIVRGCLQVDRDRRFQSMSELIKALPIGLDEEDLREIVTTLKEI